ncbi:MAG: 50S ribosomal protein L9, partial [candidate division WOR-3 bacterium]
MKILLLKDVEKLGKRGDIVEVKDGYARNYLIPKGFAVQATPSIIKHFQDIN